MRRSNKSMRKQLKALLMTVALVTLSTGLIGCNNEKKQQQTTTQVETTENKVENNIEFKSDGEPVKDDSVLERIHMYFLLQTIRMKFRKSKSDFCKTGI